MNTDNTDKVKKIAQEVVIHVEKVIEHGKKLAENPKDIGIVIGEAMNKIKDYSGVFSNFGKFSKVFAKSVADGYKEARGIKEEKPVVDKSEI